MTGSSVVEISCLARAAKARPGRRQRFTLAVAGYADSPAVLGLPARRRNSLRSLRSLRSDSRRQVSARSALRARAESPPFLSAKEAHCHLPERAFAETFLMFGGRTNTVSSVVRWKEQVPCLLAVGGIRQGRFRGRRGAQAWGRRACALQRLTRRSCLSIVSKANEASSAARPQAEHRSAVGVPADRPRMSPCRVPPAASPRRPEQQDRTFATTANASKVNAAVAFRTSRYTLNSVGELT